MHEDWAASESAENGPTYLGTFDSDPDRLVLIAPANDFPDGVYGWYEDSNPAFVIERSQVDAVLAIEPEAAHALLLDLVSEADRTFGAPMRVGV